MTPGARLSAAIEIIDAFLQEKDVLADALLRRWASGARYAGSKDRAAVADLVYAALRRLGTARLGARQGEGRAAVLGALRLEGAQLAELDAMADGGLHRPAPLSQEEKQRLSGLPARAAEERAADYPAWLLPILAGSVPDPEAEIAASAQRAAFDLRVNTLKTDAASARGALLADGLETTAGPFAPTALRAAKLGAAARPKLRTLNAYLSGQVEPQDAASQAVSLLAAALLRREAEDGVAVDLCAGGGGKTLAFAAAAPHARLCAFDVDARRMRDLPERLTRADARAELLDRSGLNRLRGRVDLALVDAPCSGSGAWARQPDAKWRLTPARLAQLQNMQAEALSLGAAALRPGGVLVYATCSLLKEENDDSLRRFLQVSDAFEPLDVETAWAEAGLRDRPPGRPNSVFDAASVLFSPSHRGSDGFYVAALRRRGRR